MTGWGIRLEHAASKAKSRVMLVAPFIKQNVIRRLILALPPRVPIRVVTRWRLDEIAAGVSDLEVYDEVTARTGSQLLLCRTLHAKYFRFDEDVVFIGSANLTNTALGWAVHNNLELLVELPWTAAAFANFERTLADSTVPATATMRDELAAAAAEMPRRPVSPDLENAETQRGAWLPFSRRPELLFHAYNGEWTDLTSAGTEQAARDLQALELPAGLSKNAFTLAVTCALLQEPGLAKLDNFLRTPRRFGEIRQLLRKELELRSEYRDPTEVTQTVLRWLLHFRPNRYRAETPGFSEIYCRVG